MPRHDKSRYTNKQERDAEKVQQRYEQKGVSEEEAGKLDTSRGSMSRAERNRAPKKPPETPKRSGRS